MITFAMRMFLSGVLLYFVYLETGAATVICLALVLLNNEITAYVAAKNMSQTIRR